MPKYTFECGECRTQFTRKLRIGEHLDHPCPSCGSPAPRLWDGETFGFGFKDSPTAAPGNSGVSKDDYPTADQAVGKDAERRWGELHARDKVKDEVRQKGGHHALQRKHGVEAGKPYIEYAAGSDAVIERRKKLVKEADKAYRETAGE